MLNVLCKIYSNIVLPEAVIGEFGPLSIECYSSEKVDSTLVGLLVSDLNLGRGEAESIALASQTGLKLVLDDLKARKAAVNLGLKVTGTIGILLKAESLALIDSAYEKARELRDKGFYISDQLLSKLSRYAK